MRLGPGAEQFEYCAITFAPDIWAADLEQILNRCKIVARVDSRVVAESRIVHLPVPFYTMRFVLPVGYAVKEGDEVSVELTDVSSGPKWSAKGDINMESEVAILGRIDGEEILGTVEAIRLRWIGSGANDWFAEPLDTPSANPAQNRAHQ